MEETKYATPTINNEDNSLSFLSQCDNFRRDYEDGENLWQEMMRNKESVSLASVIDMVDFSNILDEDETIEDRFAYDAASDSSTGFCKSSMGGNEVFFYETAGF